MSSTTPARRVAASASLRLARTATEVLAPAVLVTAMPLIVAVHAARVWPGLAWGLLAAAFSAVVPYALIRWGVRRGRLTDHHIGVREQRRVPLVLGLASVLVGLVVLVLLGAPRDLVAVVVVMFVLGAMATAVNEFWKLSIHSAVASGSFTVLAMVFGVEVWAAAPLVVLVAWSRVRLRDHTTAQVVTGVAVGVPLAAIAFALLSI
jgi:hypothetical protein